MLNKLICWLFGHKYTKSILDKIIKADRYEDDDVWVYKDVPIKTCPRCGNLLAKKGVK